MSSPERRIDYRLRYPSGLRPTLTTRAATVPIIDISESGMRLVRDGLPLRPGDRLSGRVDFRPDSHVAVNGTVLRVAGDHVAVQLQPGFNFRRIYAEYQHIQDQAQ